VAILTVRQALCAALLTIAAARPAAAQGVEYEVKAAFLYNFSKFVEWPPESLTPDAPFRICLLHDDPFGGRLERTVAGDTVDGHPIVVERVPVDIGQTSCHILFVPRSQAARVQALVRALGRDPVLTVGESPGFLAAGGIINLVVEGGHVRFDVNVDGGAARGLRISSKLLRVARNTGGAREREQP
jgi:hypothetical protein